MNAAPRHNAALVFLALLILLAAVGAASLALGSETFRWADVGWPWEAPTTSSLIFWRIRMPRLGLAMASGGALALAGLLLQTYFQNPMADSYVIGASSGATLGAVVAMLSAEAMGLGVQPALPPVAFLFSLVTLGLVWRLATQGGRTAPESLLLTGIAVSLFASALTSLIMIRARQPLHGVVFWLMGSLANATGWDALLLGGTLILAAALGMALARSLNLLMWGEETARALGARVSATRAAALGLAALLTSLSVSLNGTITFVGLITPHVGRYLVGPNHGRLIPTSLLLGAVTLAGADLVARTALAPSELPVGVVTALLGVPFFLYLMRRSRR